jgi:hypothetical protein
MSPFLTQRREALDVVLERPCLASYERALRLVSWANGRGASRGAAFAKAEEVKTQRQVGEYAGRVMFRPRLLARSPFHVVLLTRVAPRALDDDNLAHALKAVRDGVAKGLGIDDRDSRVRYVLDQQRGDVGQHLVRVALYAARESAEAQEFDASDFERPVPPPVSRGFTPTPNVVRSRK